MAKLSKQYFAADRELSFLQKRTACFLVFLLVFVSPAIAAPGDCGTVIIPVDNDIDGFNPMMSSTFAGDTAAGLMYMGLIWVNRFQQIDWSRSLASAIKTPDAGLTFQVTLRPWHWSDGTPVTTTDIAYSLKLLQDWDFSNAGGMPGIVKTFTARDATHFDLVLTHRVNPLWFIFNGLSALSPMPAHDWRRFSNDQLWQMRISCRKCGFGPGYSGFGTITASGPTSSRPNIIGRSPGRGIALLPDAQILRENISR